MSVGDHTGEYHNDLGRSQHTQIAWWRRLGAFFAAACIVLGPLEALAIPDTRDGDAIASHLAAPEHSDATKVRDGQSRPRAR